MRKNNLKQFLPIFVIFAGIAILAIRIITNFKGLPKVSPEILKSPTLQSPTPTTQVEFIDKTQFGLHGPSGYKINIFAKDLGPARMMAFDQKSGAMFVSITKEGRIVGLQDVDGDGIAEQSWDVIDGLRNPHGLAIYDGWLYIGEEHQVGRVRLFAERNYEVLIRDLPFGEGHFTRTIGFGPDGKLYLSIGSSCNVCYESDQRRAAILQFNPDGTAGQIFAEGLRNAVGFAWHPKTKELWATDNGRDYLGEDLPPDEINIVKENKDYGWPICYGAKIHDTEFDKNVYVRDPCEDTEAPIIELPAHSAPLGLRFDSEGNLFVALHGSWNRTHPAGYKVIKISFGDAGPKVSDFIWGWMPEENLKKPLGATASQFAKGRPVDIVFDDKGAMYISDDKAGMIYKVEKIVGN
ncbi:MAG: PQQ-dependent sugar dehydrogenase [Candidatus Paceibacteria bacterium]